MKTLFCKTKDNLRDLNFWPFFKNILLSKNMVFFLHGAVPCLLCGCRCLCRGHRQGRCVRTEECMAVSPSRPWKCQCIPSEDHNRRNEERLRMSVCGRWWYSWYGWWYGWRLNDPQHDKTNKMSVRPAKTQISLGIRPVWSESSLSAWRKLGSLATHWAHSEDSDQSWRMHRLIRVFAGRTLILLVLSCRGLNDIPVQHLYDWEGLCSLRLLDILAGLKTNAKTSYGPLWVLIECKDISFWS